MRITLIVFAIAFGTREALAQTVRDSAGVRIIDNRAPAWTAQQQWQVGTKALALIGAEDGAEPYLLNRVYFALRLPDGRVVVGNSGSSELRFFGADGKYQRAAGRRGEGPGEFSPVSSLVFCLLPGNDLVVSDVGLQRAHIFSVTGEFRRTFTFQHEEGSSAPALRGCFADGTLLTGHVPVSALRGAPGSTILGSRQFFRYNTAGRSVTKLAQVPDRTRFVHEFQNTTSYPFVPFSSEAFAAAASRATYVNHSGAAEIERHGPDSKLEALVRWPAQRLRTAAVYDRFVAADLASTNERIRAQYTAFYARRLPLPDFVPAVGQLVVDELDHLWVKRFQLTADSAATYEVFDPSGKWLGQVRTPGRFDLYQVGRDFLLGRQRDELGVERVAIYPLRR